MNPGGGPTPDKPGISVVPLVMSDITSLARRDEFGGLAPAT
jgi:hypothetical protein